MRPRKELLWVAGPGILGFASDSGGLGASLFVRGRDPSPPPVAGSGVGGSLRPVLIWCLLSAQEGFLEKSTEFADSEREGARLDQLGAGCPESGVG